MRRLPHHLFKFGSALSLVLCVAVCVLWVRSYWARVYLPLNDWTGSRWELSVRRGRVTVWDARTYWTRTFGAITSFTVPAAAVGGLTLLVLRSPHGHHTSPGRCPSCGYDLRASPGRCPECGAAAANS